MARPKSERTTMLTLRVTEVAVKETRRIAISLSTPDHLVTASDVLRTALRLGLPQAEQALRQP